MRTLAAETISVESLCSRLATLAKQAARERWKATVEGPLPRWPCTERLLGHFASLDLARALSRAVGDPQGERFAGLPLLVSAVATVRHQLGEDGIEPLDDETRSDLASPGLPATLTKLSAWLRRADRALGDTLGVDVGEAHLRARGLSLALAAQWLERAAATVRAIEVGPGVSQPDGSGRQAFPGATPVVATFDVADAIETLAGLGVPASVLSDIPVDCVDRPVPARCFALAPPRRLRIVVPRRSYVGLRRALAHEFGHAAYFRLAPGAGEGPWCFEPSAGPEGVAFSFEFLVALAGREGETPGRLGPLRRDTLDSVKMASLELALHRGDDIDLERVRGLDLREFATKPWSMLDYALGRLTGFVAASAFARRQLARVHGQVCRPGEVVIERLVAPGAAAPWAPRFNTLLEAVNLPEPIRARLRVPALAGDAWSRPRPGQSGG